MEAKKYIAVDRANGEIEEVSEAEVRYSLKNYVKDIDLAIRQIKQGHPQQTNFFIYTAAEEIK